jgi:acetyl-CoA acetyltransferase
MYIKKERGPAYVVLGDGTRMTRADLPPGSTQRWVASRKARVAQAIIYGLLARDEVCGMYGLSEEELAAWCLAFDTHGAAALRSTKLQKFRNA